MDVRFPALPAARRVHPRYPRWVLQLWTSLITGGLAAAGLIALGNPEVPVWEVAESFFGAGLFVLAYFGQALSRSAAAAEGGPEPGAGEWLLVLTPAGFSLSRPEWQQFVAWPDLAAFAATESHWLLDAGGRESIAVSRAALPEPADQARFESLVKELCAAHRGNLGRTLPDVSRPLGPVRRALGELWANLRAGLRFALFRPVAASDFKAAPLQLALLFALKFLLYGAADFVLNGPNPSFNVFGVGDFGTKTLLFLAAGVAVLAVVGAVDLLRWLVTISAGFLVAYLIYLLVYVGIDRLFPDSAGDRLLTGLYAAWVLWSLAIVLRAVVLLAGCSPCAALLPVSVFALFNLVLGHALPDEDIFLPAAEKPAAATADSPIDGEALFYRQRALLYEAAGKLMAGKPGVTDLYFLGFAGESDEHVFAHEVEFAKDLFDRRFGTAGRSLALVNSPATADRLPLANAHNLEAALKAVAKRMNRNEDVLFLFLTSHGSQDHRLSVQFSPLPLNDLPAARLKALLDEAGIRNRVVVVSACYSGGFLDVLQDEHSLIMTAASRDRSSFGCGTESDYTYFGQAFFVEALQNTRSFVEAFGRARAWIEAREKSEGKEPSLPQIHVGKGIVQPLSALEAKAGK